MHVERTGQYQPNKKKKEKRERNCIVRAALMIGKSCFLKNKNLSPYDDFFISES
jgi:hypothetical protein